MRGLKCRGFGLGFRVQGLGLPVSFRGTFIRLVERFFEARRAWALGFGVSGLKFSVLGLDFRFI